MAPLMAREPVILCAWALLFHGEWFKVVECWETFTSVAFGWGVGFNTLYLIKRFNYLPLK